MERTQVLALDGGEAVGMHVGGEAERMETGSMRPGYVGHDGVTRRESFKLGIDEDILVELGSAMFDHPTVVSPIKSPKRELLNLGIDEDIVSELGSVMFDDYGLVSPTESPKQYEVGQHVAQAFEDFLEEDEENVAAYYNDKCAGILDRDAINPGDLSPMFKLVNVDDNFVIASELDFEELSKWSQDQSPLKVLAKKWDSHAVFFRASHRIQGVGEHGLEEYGTGFALCKQCIGSCKHLCFTEGRTRILAWRAIHGTRVESSLFQNSQCPRCHMQLLDFDADGHGRVMHDPITGGIYDIAELAFMDACVWILSVKQHQFDVPRNPKFVKSFQKYLIPMSVTMELLYETVQSPLGCCMVHYPMVEKIRQDLRIGFPENTSASERKTLLRNRVKLFTSNCHVLGDKIEATLQGRTLKEFFREDPKAAKQYVKIWFDEMREKILNFTENKKPGEFILGTGKVLAFNEYLIAHSISAFPGSSGSAVFLVDGEPGCFIAIHLSPGSLPVDTEVTWSVLPDHNLAGNTENELYGKMYFKEVLPKLDIEHVDSHRRAVLHRFLAYHLETILENFKLDTWSELQKRWMKNSVSYLVEFQLWKCKKNLKGVFDGGETYRQQDVVVKSWYQKWGKVLRHAGSDCIAALGAQEFIQEYESF